MTTAEGLVTTVLTYGDIKQTWEAFDPPKIDDEILEVYRKVVSNHWLERIREYDRTFFEGCTISIGWCMPSRDGLHTGGIPCRLHDHALTAKEISELVFEFPAPVEEDSVFAPREVEVVA